MHPQSTRNEFLRLRVQGLSLACIGRRLNISKPTVIKWNRQCQSEIAAAAAASHLPSPISHLPEEVAALTRRLTAIKQELFSRALREIPTATLETFAGELHQRLESLRPAAPPTAVSPNGDGESTNPSGIQYPVSNIQHPSPSEPDRTPKKYFPMQNSGQLSQQTVRNGTLCNPSNDVTHVTCPTHTTPCPTLNPQLPKHQPLETAPHSSR